MLGRILSFLVKRLVRLLNKGEVKFANSTKIYSLNIFLKYSSILEIKEGVRIFLGNHLELVSNDQMTIGSHTTLNRNNQLYGDIRIGDYCVLASDIYISSYSHNFKEYPYLPIKIADSRFPIKSKSVIIEDDVWIGKGVIIMPGIYISKGSVIGANTIVNKSIYTPYSIYYGPNHPFGKRLDIIAHDAILMEERFIPNLYKGFRFVFNEHRIKEVYGTKIFFLLKKPVDSFNLEVMLNNNCNYLELYNSYPDNISISINGLPEQFPEQKEDIDSNLKSVADISENHMIYLKFRKEVNLKNTHLKWT